MKKIFLSVMTAALVSLTAFADDKQEAINFFNNYVKAANNYDVSVAAMYSPSAKIIRQVVKPDGTLVDVDTDTATYIRQMKIGQAGAKLKNYKNNYSNISATAMPNGAYKISSLRQPSNETYKLKTYMIVKNNLMVNG